MMEDIIIAVKTSIDYQKHKRMVVASGSSQFFPDDVGLISQ